MADQDPLAEIRRSLSTSKSRVSAKPIDTTEDTFMGASIGAKPLDEPLPTVPSAPPAGSLIGNAPRRRQKKVARQTSTAAIDPAQLAQFASAVSKPKEPVVEEVVEATVEEKAEETAQEAAGGLMLASPSPPPAPAVEKSPVSIKAPSPVKPPVAPPPSSPAHSRIVPAAGSSEKTETPEPDKPKSPVVEKSPLLSEKSKSPVLSDKPKSPALSDKPASPVLSDKPKSVVSDKPKSPVTAPSVEQEKQVQELQQQMSDYNALAENLLPAGEPPTAENLAIFLAPRLEKADQFDALQSERDLLQSQLEEARRSLAAAHTEAPDQAALDTANQQLAAARDQQAALDSQLQQTRAAITARDAEIGELKRRLAEQPAAITVASMEELDKEMQVRFRETADFIQEMEEFLKEHQPDVIASGSGGADL